MFFLKFFLPIVFLMGFVANIVGLVLIKRQWLTIKKHIISHALLHLAAADLIYLVVMLLIFIEQLMNHIIHPALCKPKFFLDVLSQHVSAWIIVMMSHERFQAMNRPYEYNSAYDSKTTMWLCVVWLTGTVISAPIAIFTNAIEEPVPFLDESSGEVVVGNSTILHCGSTWRDPTWKTVYFSSLAITECLIPVSFMTFFYIGVFYNFLQQIKNPRSTLCHINQQRLSAVLGMIVVGFIVSYGPFYTSQMINEFHIFHTHRDTLIYLSLVFQVLTYLNSCLNPILYSGFTKKFMLIKDLSSNNNAINIQLNNHHQNGIGDVQAASISLKAPYVPANTTTTFELSSCRDKISTQEV
ncbi:somatostatin receptor type 4-like isoform X2 [Convolutriloba macropyga]|uniref:somatostatin receptor type 4-like isoform X2 n=1 Tax=Convolutriloba macropyga TaxID=536237 RepID=UPI003F51BFE5